MTLDLTKYFQTRINKESDIGHFQGKIIVGKTKQLADNLAKKIQDTYGQTVLDGTQYLVLATLPAELNEDTFKNDMFNTVNRAFGNGSNNSNIADYKSVELDKGKKVVFAPITLKI